MMVSVNYRDAIKAAYKRGASDATLHLRVNDPAKFPKPDVERYLAELDKRPTVVKL